MSIDYAQLVKDYLSEAETRLSSLLDDELKEHQMQMIFTAANVFKDLMERIESNQKYRKLP